VRYSLVSALVGLSVSLLAGGACFDATDPQRGDASPAVDTGTDAPPSSDAQSCEEECTAPDAASRSVSECVSGSCKLRCEQGWVDTDEDLADGCERVEGCTPSNGGTERCDGRDNDCDGETDEGVEDPPEWYADSDGDGFGDPERSTENCERPENFVDNGDDCNDSDPEVRPREFFRDRDGDDYTTDASETRCRIAEPPEGFAAESSAELDCNDSNPDVFPGAAEACDGEDTDCDGRTDNIPQDGSAGRRHFIDCDGDSFAASRGGSVWACPETGPSSGAPSGCTSSMAGWTTVEPDSSSTTDCNDEEPKARPNQSNYFATPMAGAGSSRVDRWDYDCDGDVETKWGTSDCLVENGNCSDGFAAIPEPKCGVTGDLYRCNAVCCTRPCAFRRCSACPDSTDREDQACR